MCAADVGFAVDSIGDEGRIRVNAMSTPLVLGALLFLSGPAPQVDPLDPNGAPDAQTGEPCGSGSSSALATFADGNLEAAVRSALSVGEGIDLPCGRVSTLTSLVAAEADIESLEGIQSLTGLEELNLWGNEITDITPLDGLTSLHRLVLGANAVADVSALAGLTGLRFLQIRENEIGDIGALAGLTQLIDLDISYNDISDIGALSGLTRLTTLRVYYNPITDIGAMRGMTSLTELHVHDLPDLTTLQPLVENTGLGEGDVVIVYNSNVCSEVRALRDKGVRVPGCVIESVRHWWWAILLGVGLAAVGVVLVRRRNERRWAAWRAEAAQGIDPDAPV
jgi:hypothetical protein